MATSNNGTPLPISSTFPYEDYEAYREEYLGSIGYTPLDRIWTPDNLDNQRLPGNRDIWEFLIYVGYQLRTWLTARQYSGEMPLYTPGDPDIMYSKERLDELVRQVTGDSPHLKVPPIIMYSVDRRTPASMRGGKMFGAGKHWKFRLYGDFQGSDGNVYRLRARWWENLIRFRCAGRSGAEAEYFCRLFEHFMDLNEGKLLEGGVGKVVPYGRRKEQGEQPLVSNVIYRDTLFYFRTQEFQWAGPITPISSVDIESYVADPSADYGGD